MYCPAVAAGGVDDHVPVGTTVPDADCWYSMVVELTVGLMPSAPCRAAEYEVAVEVSE
jgi:hypothetical protein